MLSPLEIERNELGYTLEEVRGKFLRVVERSCPSSDTCVFMAHGGGGRAGQFKHQIKALEKEFNVVALDFLGHGDSPKPNQPGLYSADEHFEDLKAVYERHRKERNVLVAHCYGCIHTLRLVKWLREQGREGEVRGVVMISLGGSSLSVGFVSKLPSFFLEWVRPMARASSNATLFTSKTDPALIEFENSISNGNRMYTMKVIAADTSNQQAWARWLDEGREGLGEIPRALICGEEDGVFPVSACEQAKKTLGVEDDWFQIIPAAGHLSMLESPHEVNRIIQDFLSAHL